MDAIEPSASRNPLRKRIGAALLLLLAAGAWWISQGSRPWPLHAALKTGAAPLAIAFTPDGRTLAVGDDQGGVTLWDLAGRRVVARLGCPGPAVLDVGFTADGRTVVAWQSRPVATLWDVATRRELGMLVIPSDCGAEVTPAGIVRYNDGFADSLYFGPGYRDYYEAGVKTMSYARLYDGKSGLIAKYLDALRHSPRFWAWLGGHGVLASPEGKVYVWDVPQDVNPSQPSELWDARSGRVLARLAGPRYWWDDLFSPDGKLLCQTNPASMMVLEVATGRGLGTIGMGDLAIYFADPLTGQPPGARPAFSPNGRYLAAGGIVTVEEPGWQARLPHSLRWKISRRLGFKPRRSKYGSPIRRERSSAVVRVWDVTDGRPVSDFPVDHRHVAALAFSPDGRFLAAACKGEKVVKLWEVPAAGRSATPLSFAPYPARREPAPTSKSAFDTSDY